MTPNEIRQVVGAAPVYKMSLGRSGGFRSEAFESGMLLYQSDAAFYDALDGTLTDELTAGRKVVNASYPKGGAKDATIRVWAKAAHDFSQLPGGCLILHWQTKLATLWWGLTSGKTEFLRMGVNSEGATMKVFSHSLVTGWRDCSLAGVPLVGLHPEALDFVINQATFTRVKTNDGYFKSLILGEDVSEWVSDPSWVAKAAKSGWAPPTAQEFVYATAASLAQDVADFFDAEAERMAKTALHTAAYADGKTVSVTVKFKELGFSRTSLEARVRELLKEQGNACALTGYRFTTSTENPYLRPSLDRIDPSIGYMPGNLQVVTRAANFFKSASGEADWALKLSAMEKMALAMQKKHKAAAVGS